MKRLFASIGLSMFVSHAIVLYLGFLGKMLLISGVIIFLLVGLFYRKSSDIKKTFYCISIVILISLTYFNFYTNLLYQDTEKVPLGEAVEIVGVISEDVYESSLQYCYEIKSEYVDNRKIEEKFLVRSLEEFDAEYGAKIKLEGIIEEADYNYYKSKGILFSVKAKDFFFDYEVIGNEGNPVKSFIISIKNKLVNAITFLIRGHEGDLSVALALGDKSELDDIIMDAFEKTGLTHIIVVSGMHLTTVTFFISILLKGLPNKKRYNLLRFVLIIFVLIMFMAITGFSPSIVRSGITAFILNFTLIVDRKYEPLNALGIAAIVQTLNPYIVGDIGVILSYISILGIILIYMPVSKYVKKKTGYDDYLERYYWKKSKTHNVIIFYLLKILFYTIDLILVSFSASIALIPALIFMFGKFNILSCFFTVCISLAANILLVCLLILSIIYYIPYLNYLAYFLSDICYYLAKYIVSVVRWGAQLSFSLLYVDSYYFAIWFVLTGIMVVCVCFFKKRLFYIGSVVAISIIFGIFMLLYINVSQEKGTVLSVYPCGKGMTVTFESDNKVSLLSCGGDYEYNDSVIRTLHNKFGKDIELMVVPSTKNSHTYYVNDILNEFELNSVLLYFGSGTDEKTYRYSQKVENYYEYMEDDCYEIELDENFTDVVINKKKRTYQYIHSENTSVLLIEEKSDCENIPEEYRSADIVILCDIPKNIKLLNYGQIIYSSNEKIQEKIKNVYYLGEEEMEILLN